LRGNITPVFDLHELFGASVVTAKRRAIVIGSGETSVAFWVDGMPSMVVLGAEDDMSGDPPLPEIIKNYANRYFLKDNQIWVEWNVRRFFTALGEML
jgi:chemotaxis signal transduction protein